MHSGVEMLKETLLRVQGPGLRVAFGGLPQWTGPATWGQRAIWSPLRWYAPHDHYFNIGAVVTLGSGLPAADVVAVLRTLMERHESLRTRFECAEDGSPRQLLAGEGELDVAWTEAGRESAPAMADQVLAAMLEVRFDLEADLPIRFSAVGADGMVHALVPVVSHIAADSAGFAVLVEDLRRLAAARRRNPSRLPERPPGRTPREQTVYEATPTALHRDEAARAHWRRVLEIAPPVVLPPPASSQDATPWRQALLEGGGLDAASRWLARLWRCSPRAVVLAAYVRVLAAQTGLERVALKVVVGNRAAPEQRDAVGVFSQDGLVCLEPGDLSLREFAKRAEAAQLNAARHAQFEPGAMAREVASAESRRGTALELDCHFNDYRDIAPSAVPESVADLVPGTLRWGDAWSRQDCALFFALRPMPAGAGAGAGAGANASAPRPVGANTSVSGPAGAKTSAPRARSGPLRHPGSGAVAATLLADTRRLPPDQVEALLRAVEDLVISTARTATV